jgi:AraC-like DNA-binding protein
MMAVFARPILRLLETARRQRGDYGLRRCADEGLRLECPFAAHCGHCLSVDWCAGPFPGSSTSRRTGNCSRGGSGASKGMAPRFHPVAVGLEHLAPCCRFDRHRHLHGYAALVLHGGYEEAGDRGRWRVASGDVLIHRAFDAHQDRVHQRGSTVLNLPIPADADLPAGFRISDPDELVRLARTDLGGALAFLLETAREPLRARNDWPDLLAQALRSSRHFNISLWADSEGLNPATVSRGFRLAYGIGPSRYRREVRARRALEMLGQCGHSLSSIAYACGFADQPHMSRVVREITGCPPGRWVREVKSVQEAGRSAG